MLMSFEYKGLVEKPRIQIFTTGFGEWQIPLATRIFEATIWIATFAKGLYSTSPKHLLDSLA